MNEQIKQRLVGAVVLVSLAVIFIPMLLDGGERSSMPRYGSNIPPQPELQFEPLVIPLEPVTPIPAETPRLVDKVEPAPEPVAESPPAAPAPEKPTALPSAPTKPAATVPSSPPAPSGSAEAWVVQVGSFGQSDNALALRDKLRRNGFTAFVEKVGADGGAVYRVRIGPELRRENAERQLTLLSEKMQLKGIILGHP